MESTSLFYPQAAVGALPLASSALPTMPLAPPNIHNPSPPCTPGHHSLQQQQLSHKLDVNQKLASALATTPLAPPPSGHMQAYPTPCLSQMTAQPQQQQTLACPPRVQVQQLCLPREQHARPTLLPVPGTPCGASGAGYSSSASSMDPKLAKANFVDSLVDTATVVIESIWPPPPTSPSTSTTSSFQQQKALPLRTFVQETLKRSRSSYSTLQTALYYLYKIRNKVPSEFLKRRNDQLYHNYQLLSAHAAGLATPPPSPMHLQQDTFSSTASAIGAVPSSTSSTDYFSLRAAATLNAGHQPSHAPTLPSPVSTASNASMSPSDSCESAADSTTSSSPSASTCSSAPHQPQQQPPQPQCHSSSNNSNNSSNNTSKILYCGRRTFLAALMVASKYLQDRNYSNKAWAKISGLSIKEINANELVFLKLVDYSLFVSHETFMRWTALLLAHGQEATRRFMQNADAASAAAIAMRVRHHQLHLQQQQQQQQLYLQNRLTSATASLTSRGPSCLSAGATAWSAPVTNDSEVTHGDKDLSQHQAQRQQQHQSSRAPKQGDRGMYWTAVHSRPDEQHLLVQQRQSRVVEHSTTTTTTATKTMLSSHLVLTPPDHADEVYPSGETEKISTTVPLASTITSCTSVASTAMDRTRSHSLITGTASTAASATAAHVDAVLPVDSVAGCKRRRDIDSGVQQQEYQSMPAHGPAVTTAGTSGFFHPRHSTGIGIGAFLNGTHRPLP
ncbi:hypothetical protein BGZ73_001735 [Actinomortierella ambigua]|nr:hypothetical protein BGZ73_001735 [Actinomortierella ambigua]